MKVLIIEDESAAARNLTTILHEIAPQIEILETLESVQESVEWLEANPMPDLIFMDIHLADGDSFMIFGKVEITAPIIFCTAYDRYALEAFKVNSIDYILKPINQEQLQRALDKLKLLTSHEIVEQQARVEKVVAARNESQQHCDTFLSHVRDKIIPIKADQIAFIYTTDDKVWAYTLDGKTLPIDKRLDHLQGQLNPNDFYRANRQFIVARVAIHDISTWFGSRLQLNLKIETPEKIIISKARVAEFKGWLTQLHPTN